MAVRAGLVDPSETRVAQRHEEAALGLAGSLPRLVVAARRASATVVHGLHGRRRSGTGENFWQFRRFTAGEPAGRIDWRRSARDDNVYIREQEWEAAHTVWIWIDRSRSMAFRSSLSETSKVERAVVLGLALADVLVRGGERVGLLGLTRPTASRNAIENLAQALIAAGDDDAHLPPKAAPIARLSEAIVIGDLLAPEEEIAATVASLAARGGRGHLVAIVDPVEETFPFTGRTEFLDPDVAGLKLVAGRAEEWRQGYAERLARHRAALADIVRRHGWALHIHRTDRPATEPLLALHARLAEPAA
ncbi:uncharacterized protein (DUF58 family) [Methylopila capsulata]|uniref:Uncharacterized protein (DUF58 family) n=1 Tax=Methylopila capsulata TaxID=61654 RepID=A0A9W6MSQ5_9HYPH|nr:DUF58 domain-containing protein [Methylopila capsulata]MBM7852293.1 uncharacterized protein (DUF58 family) [Methylopila capsulata]GLK56502.1 hypothetical protein GCM10008170_25210 [Methylopila capsulata]